MKKTIALLAFSATVLLTACDQESNDTTPAPPKKPQSYIVQRIRCSFGKERPDVIYEPAYRVSVYRNGVDFYYQGVEISISPNKACMSSPIEGYPDVSMKQNSETQLYEFTTVDR